MKFLCLKKLPGLIFFNNLSNSLNRIPDLTPMLQNVVGLNSLNPNVRQVSLLYLLNIFLKNYNTYTELYISLMHNGSTKIIKYKKVTTYFIPIYI
jgi:hypothetical protein